MQGAEVTHVLNYKENKNENSLFISKNSHFISVHTFHQVFSAVLGIMVLFGPLL